MFERFRRQLNGLIKHLSEKELNEGDLNSRLHELELLLVQNDVAIETAERIARGLRDTLIGLRVSRWKGAEETIRGGLKKALLEVFAGVEPFYLDRILEGKPENEPLVVVFVGINGVGKSTTIAKIAHRFKRDGHKVVLACSDTYRAGAIEQLEIHSSRLGLKMIKQRYGADPAAVAYDAVDHAKARGVEVVLIDTAGRQHIDVNLMNELKKVVKVAEPDAVVLVVDSLTGNDGIRQAEEFLRYTGFDAVVMTKMDADARGGIAISVADRTSKPIIFVGTGQDYDDLEPFDYEAYVNALLGGLS